MAELPANSCVGGLGGRRVDYRKFVINSGASRIQEPYLESKKYAAPLARAGPRPAAVGPARAGASRKGSHQPRGTHRRFPLIRPVSGQEKKAPPRRGEAAPITCEVGAEGVVHHRMKNGRRTHSTIVELLEAYRR